MLRRAAVTLASALALVGPATVARAADPPPSLQVTNLGQATAPVVVPQAPVLLGSRSDCARPFTISNPSACPAGAWPPLGATSSTPGGWSPSEHVAGGDTLRLQFSAPVETVGVASTSNYVPGLRDPDGNAVSNFDVIAESGAVPTAEPTVWLVQLPPLDYRAISGYTFSVASRDGAGSHDYALEIRSPRFADESVMCGTAYYSTGREQGLCYGPGQMGTPPHHRAPRHFGKRHPRRCRKGLRKRTVNGKKRCVKGRKHR